MASDVLTSRVIRGIKYNKGDSFICAYSAKGNAGSEGNDTSASALTVGDRYYFLGYAVATDSGTTIKYPCKVGSNASSAIGWYKEDVFPYGTYTVTYNANGGSLGSVPSTQKKTHDTDIKVSSSIPTRTGYTFLGWAVPTRTDVDEKYKTEPYYQPSATIQYNGNQTLKAVWAANKLSVNYYSNFATSAFSDALNTVSSKFNVKVAIVDYYYDKDYSTYGLANYSNSNGSVYMTRTGYTATGKWGTSMEGGTLVDENTTFDSGQAIAEAFGKDLSSESTFVNLYPQWSENALTINYYSNYADYGTFNGETLNVSANNNVVVYSHKYYYDNAYSDGLYNIQNSEKLYLSRTGYTSTLHWGTSVEGGILIDQYTTFDTGQSLAKTLGKDISNGEATIDLYPQWRVNVLTIKYNVNSGVVNSDKYNINNNLIGLISSSSVLEDKWNYNRGHTDGLYNAETFGLTREGYKFIGWKVGSSGTTVFDQDDSSVVPTDLTNNIKTGDSTVTLYAVWKPSGIVYIDDGVNIEPYLVYIDNGAEWDLYMAYIDNGTDWDTIS